MEKVSVAVKAIDPYDHQVDCRFLTRTELEKIDLEKTCQWQMFQSIYIIYF